MDHVDEPRSLSQINRELAPPSDKDTVSIAEAKLNGEGVSSSSGTETTARGQQRTADVNTASRQVSNVSNPNASSRH
ncbi:hypothetical protein FRB93_000946 [Tulasnella sp. JGI-2019a]|nr:hypothetical protein FRB93_000946 [Tulasnella sp. JGI-2019a]